MPSTKSREIGLQSRPGYFSMMVFLADKISINIRYDKLNFSKLESYFSFFICENSNEQIVLQIWHLPSF